MKSLGIPAGLITHNAVMAACDRGGVWEDAMAVMREMRDEGITPDVIGYASAIRYVYMSGKLRTHMILQISLVLCLTSEGRFANDPKKDKGTMSVVVRFSTCSLVASARGICP